MNDLLMDTNIKESNVKITIEKLINEFFIERYFSLYGANSPERAESLYNSVEYTVQDFYSSTLKESGVSSSEFKEYTDTKMNESIYQIKKALSESIANGNSLDETLRRTKQIYDKETAEYTRAAEDAKWEAENLSNLTDMSLWGYNRYVFKASGENPCKDCLSLSEEVFTIEEAQARGNVPPIHPNCRCTLEMDAPESNTELEKILNRLSHDELFEMSQFYGIIKQTESKGSVTAQELRDELQKKLGTALGGDNWEKVGDEFNGLIKYLKTYDNSYIEGMDFDIDGSGDNTFKGGSWLSIAEGSLPYIYSTKDPNHNPWTGGFDPNADLTFGIGHSIKTAEEFSEIKNFIATHTASEIDAKVQSYNQTDMKKAVDSVNAFMKNNGVQLKQHQFDAVVSLVFNQPAAISEGSDLSNALIAGDFSQQTIVDAFTYTRFQGERIDGLVTRRNNEIYLFLTGDYSNYYDSKEKVISAGIDYIGYP